MTDAFGRQLYADEISTEQMLKYFRNRFNFMHGILSCMTMHKPQRHIIKDNQIYNNARLDLDL